MKHERIVVVGRGEEDVVKIYREGVRRRKCEKLTLRPKHESNRGKCLIKIKIKGDGEGGVA
jgi:hypothetical protein